MSTVDDNYPCVGICMIDAESGYCLGCGRPPLPMPKLPDETESAQETRQTEPAVE